MGKVLNFRQKERQEDRITRKMIEIADDIDAVILKHLQDKGSRDKRRCRPFISPTWKLDES